MALKTIYTGATGINNKVDPVRLKFDSKTGIHEGHEGNIGMRGAW